MDNKRKNPLASFIFPVHNEGLSLLNQLKLFIPSVCKLYGDRIEIIFIENGSSDDTWNKLLKIKSRFPWVYVYQLPYASYGEAIKVGLVRSKSPKKFVLNIDYFDISFIQKAYLLLDHIDIVIGSKTLVKSRDDRPFIRRISTYFFNVFLRLVLNYPGTDTHGIKAFRSSLALEAAIKDCKTQNELFDTELVLRLTHQGLLFVDLPQCVTEVRTSRYVGFSRIKSTFFDLVIAVYRKYISHTFFDTTLVDADDYGFSSKVNRAIEQAVYMNKIQIISVMPNLIEQKDVEKLLKLPTSVAFSMHFNVLRGRPILERRTIPSIVDSNGVFYSLPFFMARLLCGFIDMEDVKKEWKAQYKRLTSIGISPSYLNSEQHLHTFSPLNILMEELISGTFIKKIRSIASTKHYLQRKPLRFIVFLLLFWLAKIRWSGIHEFKQYYDAYIIHPGTNYDPS